MRIGDNPLRRVVPFAVMAALSVTGATACASSGGSGSGPGLSQQDAKDAITRAEHQPNVQFHEVQIQPGRLVRDDETIHDGVAPKTTVYPTFATFSAVNPPPVGTREEGQYFLIYHTDQGWVATLAADPRNFSRCGAGGC